MSASTNRLEPTQENGTADFPALPLTKMVPLIPRTAKEKTVAMLKETTRIGIPIAVIVAACCTVGGLLYTNIMVKFSEITAQLVQVNKESSERNERVIRLEMQREFDAKMSEQMNAKLNFIIDTQRAK